MTSSAFIEKAYKISQEQYAAFGVDTEKALERLDSIAISLQCWQGDDIQGFESSGTDPAAGGLRVTGNSPGKARNMDELKMDLRQAFSLIPGRHRLNLHAIYGDFGVKKVDRNEIELDHFRSWIEWARQEKLKIDFNSTCFGHPQAASGFTLSNRKKDVREFWIEHVRRCRKISAGIGRELESSCIHNLWIPDGSKDIPVDRWTLRRLLNESLDRIFVAKYSPRHMQDSLESKLFGIGSECFVVGSHEFYLGYCLSHNKMICLDLGHFHPTESIADKISALLPFLPGIVLHISRGVRWDSDHVVILNDEIRAVTEEIVRSNAPDRIFIALDFFDASINRIGAWVAGARATLQGLLLALLEPEKRLKDAEKNGRYLERLALLEELKFLSPGPVWDYYCLRKNVPPGIEWLEEVNRYEQKVLSQRT